LALLLPAGRADAAVSRYTLLDLGSLGGTGFESQATCVNNAGQIAGWTQIANGNYHAFLYSHGSMTDLGTLPGGTYSYATGINDSQQVVGRSYTNSMGFFHAFLYQNGTMADLGTLPGGDISMANAINASGLVVGTSTSSSGLRAFSYAGGVMMDLGLPPAPLPSSLPPGATWVWTKSQGQAVNASGRVAGYSEFLYNQPPTLANLLLNKAFVYTQANGMTAFGPNPDAGYVAYATGINATDLIVGHAYFSNPYMGPVHAFSYRATGVMTDLGTLGGDRSFAYGVNNFGQVVGQARNSSGQDLAFLYTQGAMRDLNTLITGANPFIRLETALAINDNGVIVGGGRLADGTLHAFAAIPRSPNRVTTAAQALLLLNN